MKSSYIALYRIIFSYKCVIRGTISLNKVSGRRMRAGPLWSCCRILPTAVFCHVVCVSREGWGDVYFCTPLNPTFILSGMVMVVGSL